MLIELYGEDSIIDLFITIAYGKEKKKKKK